MRKAKRFPLPRLRVRSLLVLAGALILMAALAPTAKADLIAYFNFEDSVDHGPPDFTSDIVPENPGGGIVLTTITTDYTSGEVLADHPGTSMNRSAGDIDVPPLTPALDAILTDAGNNNSRHFDFNVFSSQSFFENMTLSFAVWSPHAGGFTDVTVQFSVNGGGTWTTFGTAGISLIPSTLSFNLPAAANNSPLAIRFFFTGGTGTNPRIPYTQFDNMQLTGTIVPEPATMVGGLLGVLGLCWHQRRRLIRSVRFRYT